MINHRPARTSPIIVGGLGGSGTRVVAELLMAMGVDMGQDLNVPKDNVLFTLLLKRPYWYREAVNKAGEIAAILELHDRLLAGGRPTGNDWRHLLMAALDAVRYDHIGIIEKFPLLRYPKRIIWSLTRLRNLLLTRPAVSSHWGWKEPNVHIYLEHLSRCYPEMRYIHVIRHGLDMAFSKNQFQLCNWGGVLDPAFMRITAANYTPRDALRYWVVANERAVSVSRNLFGRRFLLINYDDLCVHPETAIKALSDFIGQDIGEAKMARMKSIPRITSSRERYRSEDLSIFDKNLIDRVRRMGFTVATPSCE